MAIYETIGADGKKRYRVQVDMGRRLDGKRDRKTKKCTTLKEAKAAERRFELERDGLNGKSNRITLSTFIADWYLPLKEKVLRRNTISGYKRDIKYFLPILGGQLIGDIDRYKIQRMLSDCPTYAVAKNTRDTLRAILNEAVGLELLTRNPAAGRFEMPEAIEAPESEEQSAPWVTSFAEHRRLIEAAHADKNDEVERLLTIGLCFGLRKGEILGLDWQGVDLKRSQIYIYQTYTATRGQRDLTPPKTRGSRRVVPMTYYAKVRIKKWQQGMDHIGPVCTYKGARLTPDRANKILIAFFKKHPELPRVTCSSMRHSFATSAILAGENVANVARWLGHKDITTTLNRYVKPLQSDLESAAKRIQTQYYGT